MGGMPFDKREKGRSAHRAAKPVAAAVVGLVDAISGGRHPLALSPDEVRAVALSRQWNK